MVVSSSWYKASGTARIEAHKRTRHHAEGRPDTCDTRLVRQWRRRPGTCAEGDANPHATRELHANYSKSSNNHNNNCKYDCDSDIGSGCDSECDSARDSECDSVRDCECDCGGRRANDHDHDCENKPNCDSNYDCKHNYSDSYSLRRFLLLCLPLPCS